MSMVVFILMLRYTTGTTEGRAQTACGGSALAANYLDDTNNRRPSDHSHFQGYVHRAWESIRRRAGPRGIPAAHGNEDKRVG
jgi:hypothetical protein